MSDRVLALFDLDGTITTGDTMFAFVRHCHGHGRFLAGMVALGPMLLAHRVGLVDAERAKVRLLTHFFRGWTRVRLTEQAASFGDVIDRMVRPQARERLAWHRDAGHEIYVVSASLELWVRPWATRHGVGLLCTEAAFDADVWWGALATRNCNGPEKAARVRSALRIEEYTRVYTYGDSHGDRELLALGHESAYRPFRDPVSAQG